MTTFLMVFLSVFIIIASIGFIALRFFTLHKSYRKTKVLRTSGVQTTAVINKIAYNLFSFTALVSFTDNGNTVNAQIKNSRQGVKPFKVGDSIPIIYDPKSPTHVIWAEHVEPVYRMISLGIVLIFIIIGFTFSMLGVDPKQLIKTSHLPRILFLVLYAIGLAFYPVYAKKTRLIKEHSGKATAEIMSVGVSGDYYILNIKFNTERGEEIKTQMQYYTIVFFARELVGKKIPIIYDLEKPQLVISDSWRSGFGIYFFCVTIICADLYLHVITGR